jgi:trigger factor
METIFEKSSSTIGRLKVELKQADYQPDVDKKIREYAKTAQIKGFRKGFVPAGYIKKIYGKSLLVDAVINKVSNTVNAYIKDNELKVVGDPMPNNEAYTIDWDKDVDYTFEYEVGLASDFEVDLDKIPAIENLIIEPAADQIDKAVQDMRERFGRDLEPQEAEIGDLLFGVLRQASSEFEGKSGIPTDKVSEKSQKLFKGLEIGSKVSFDIQQLFDNARDLGFATGKSDEDAAALSGEFEFEVEKISRVAPAELDQEFFDQAVGQGKVSNEEELRNEVAGIIKTNYNRESEYLLDFEVEQALLDQVKIEIPDEFLKKWLLQVNEGKFTEEDIEKDYKAFARGLRLDLIKAEIAKKHEIKVDYPAVLDEVKIEIRNYFGSQGFDGMEDFIEQLAKKQLEENKDGAFRKYFDKAFGRAVINFAKEKITLNEKSVKVEEFNDVAKARYESL